MVQSLIDEYTAATKEDYKVWSGAGSQVTEKMKNLKVGGVDARMDRKQDL